MLHDIACVRSGNRLPHPDRSIPDETRSQRILDRVARQAGADAMPKPDAAEDDWAERWGRRIGAVLGPALLALLAAWALYRLYGGG